MTWILITIFLLEIIKIGRTRLISHIRVIIQVIQMLVLEIIPPLKQVEVVLGW